MLMDAARRQPDDVGSDGERLPFMLPGMDYTARSCWRVPLRGMQRPAPSSGGDSEVASIRLFYGPERRLFLPILTAGQLIGASLNLGPGVLGKGYMECGWDTRDDFQKAVVAANAAGCDGIIFEATVKERTYKRQGTNEGGQDGVVRAVTPGCFTRTCSGSHWCAHPDSLLIVAAIIRDDFTYFAQP